MSILSLFFSRRPEPMFGPGDLLIYQPDTLPTEAPTYMVVRYCRWVTPTGYKYPRWVYDGLRINIVEGQLRSRTYTSCVSEIYLTKATWDDWHQDILLPTEKIKTA
ncbi:hypothetical protein H6788_02740 [Candidatus Nomurabacteria bacterium]|nr:hypothetical protein [Candidatus Nomurabacteria bacterium]MCB9819283.1 hypothetical protein [Candidatus Nomurabacteria bacterium]